MVNYHNILLNELLQLISIDKMHIILYTFKTWDVSFNQPHFYLTIKVNERKIPLTKRKLKQIAPNAFLAQLLDFTRNLLFSSRINVLSKLEPKLPSALTPSATINYIPSFQHVRQKWLGPLLIDFSCPFKAYAPIIFSSLLSQCMNPTRSTLTHYHNMIMWLT